MAPRPKTSPELKICPYLECSKKISRKNLSTHLRQVHLEQKPSCQNCGKPMTKLALNFHSSNCPIEDRDKYRCELCGKSFNSVSKKFEHEVDHPPPQEREPVDANAPPRESAITKRGGKKFYRCLVRGCGEEFLSTMQRKLHEATKHKYLVLCPYVRYRIDLPKEALDQRFPDNQDTAFHGVFIKQEIEERDGDDAVIKQEIIEDEDSETDVKGLLDCGKFEVDLKQEIKMENSGTELTVGS